MTQPPRKGGKNPRRMKPINAKQGRKRLTKNQSNKKARKGPY